MISLNNGNGSRPKQEDGGGLSACRRLKGIKMMPSIALPLSLSSFESFESFEECLRLLFFCLDFFLSFFFFFLSLFLSFVLLCFFFLCLFFSLCLCVRSLLLLRLRRREREQEDEEDELDEDEVEEVLRVLLGDRSLLCFRDGDRLHRVNLDVEDDDDEEEEEELMEAPLLESSSLRRGRERETLIT